MRCACIDVGSNTTRLLVAEAARDGRGLHEVASAREYTRLGTGRGPDGRLDPERVAAVVAAVAAQVARARASHASHVRVVGTAAIRMAPDAADLLVAIRAACGEHLTVLGGQDEARYAFRGATCRLDAGPGDPIAVVDVGGGSTELTCGQAAGDPDWVASLPLGSAGLTERFLRHDPPLPEELEALAEHVRGALAGVLPPPTARGLAVGGSAVALGVGAGPRTHHELAAAARSAAGEASAALARRGRLHPSRARVLPAGLLLLAAAAEALEVTMEVARGGLREGVVLELLAGAGRGATG